MALRRRPRQLVSLGAVASLLGIGMAAIGLGESAGAAPASTVTAPATARVYYFTRGADRIGYRLDYKASPGQRNDLTVTSEKSGGGKTFTYTYDDIVEISAGPGCAYPDATDHTRVTCTIDDYDANLYRDEPISYTVTRLYDQDDTVTFSNPAGTRVINQFVLGNGNDTLRTKSSDLYFATTVWGGPGEDIITGHNGPILEGGEGNDVVRAIGKGTSASGNEGDDTITGGVGAQVLRGDAGNDVIHGGSGNDSVYGDEGNNKLYGDAGNDIVMGGNGKDLVYGGAGNDGVLGEGGNDKVYGGAGNDRLSGSSGNDVLYGDAGDDRLEGGIASDKLYGNSGVDKLFGQAGNDWLYGGLGKDVLNGGAGKNTLKN
ncbi:calcium-binding protein [Kineosporia sp. NBRC 101731]|uniref:calcium-binding protein n=1 Tax=Kineosporia sp. NBRC 101731 TaxID=3032199 RepID=UPI0024A1772E|nr:calcium-binding protein [Kineosporia sp. NBRC 101731]GLY26813.1 hypothetical protein Kisp02_01780 [Kineosporia sp. NBRC 101731]